jgi:lipoprotein signal peptidase
MSQLARILLGDVAPGRKFRDLFFLAGPWLLVDIVTKCLALGWLAGKDLRFFEGGVQLQLSINESLFSATQSPSSFGITHAMVLGGVMGQGLLACGGLVFGRADWTVIRKLVLMGLVVIVGAGLGLFAGSLFAGEPHRLVVHAIRAFGSLAVLLLALRLTRSRYLGFALGLCIAGNLGNAVNVLYYPRGIIDFVYVPRLRNYIGIFNMSDVALEFAKGLLFLSPLVLVLFRQLVRRSAAWKSRLEYANSTETPVEKVPA